MDKHLDFIGICLGKELEGKKYVEWLPIYEQKLQDTPYDLDNAVLYLNNVCILSTIYTRLNLWDKHEKLLIEVERICHLVKEYEEEAVYVCEHLKSKLYREHYETMLNRHSLRKITKFAIKHDNIFVMCNVINLWGNYFNNLGHHDLALLFYAYCLDFAHQKRLILNDEYPYLAYYPISNIIEHLKDEDERYELIYKIFKDNSFDEFTRLYFGERLQTYSYFQHKEFEKPLYDNLVVEVLGDLNHLSFENQIYEYYQTGDMDGLDSFYVKHNKEFYPYLHILYYAISDCEDKAKEMQKWLNNETFRSWLNYLSSYMDDISTFDKDAYFLRFLDFLRNSFCVINYSECGGFTDYLEDKDTMFNTKQVGLLMLKHAGDNGIYTFAEELVLEMMPYCQFRKGCDWLSDAIVTTGVGNSGFQQEIIKTCNSVLNEQCCFENNYSIVQSNVEICRKLLTRDNYDQADTVNIEITKALNEYKNSPVWRLFARASYSEHNNIPKLDRFLVGTTLLVKDNPHYKILKDVMEKCGWDVDEKDLNINILHAYCGDDYCLLYLFYSPIQTWLADEERFNDDDPLWFSESSHIVSPVWRIRNFMNSRLIEDLTQLPLVVLLPPTYIINGEEMEESWNSDIEVVVVKYREIIRSLNTDGTLPKETNHKEVSDQQSFFPDTPGNRLIINNSGEGKTKVALDNKKDTKSKNQEDNTEKKKQDILENKEDTEKKKSDELNDPWNLSMVYQVWKSTHYRRDVFGFNSSKTKDGVYELTGIGLLQVVDLFLQKLTETIATRPLANHTKEVTFGLYFKKTSVRFKLTAEWLAKSKETQLKEFIIDDFNDDRMEFIKGIDLNFGRLDGNDLYFRGNLVPELIETVIKINNSSSDGFSYVKSNKDNMDLSLVAEIFKYALVAYYPEETWERGVSGVSAPILADVVKREAEKTAKTAIMSRNMSHNLGSHVMAYLKRDLATVGDIMRKGVLHDFYPLPDDLASRSSNYSGEFNYKELLELIDTRTKEVEMPFLVGLGKFISYLQERQDFIATVATFYIPYFSAVNFKDDIYDTINPDYRYLRHSDRRGNRPENILMKYIALSEGLSRDITQQGPRKNDIIIRFRKFDGTNDYLFQNQRQEMKPNGPGRADLNDMRQYSFYLPGGIVGRQALFTILENLIRNSAKHGLWRQKHNLVFTFDIHRGRDFATNPHNKELYDFLMEEPGWTNILSSKKNILNKYYILTLTDNLDIDDSSFNSLKNAIKEEYVSAETGKMINKHKGIKEIRISAAWMRGIADDLNIPSDEPPVVTVRKVNNSLQYIFCVLAPKKVLLLVDDKEEFKQLQTIIQEWEGWYIESIDHYKKTNDKSYDVIALHNREELESLRPISADRLVVAEELFNKIINKTSGQDECEAALYKKLYHIKDYDEPLLISDGKTGSPISTHIHLVSADAEALTKNVTYRYCYRTHHQDPQEFSDYMNSKLKESMDSVEGITGNNSTDRLIRNEKLDDIWYFKHLHALRTKVAIFDERMFSKVTGLEDKELTANPSPFVKGSRESVVYSQKRIWFFNVIFDEEQKQFDIYGLQGEYVDGDGMYYGKINKVAEIVSNKIEMGDLGVIPSISINIFEDNYKKFADYISIHQGLMDKIYDAFKIKQSESYSEEVQKDSSTLSLAIKTAMCSASVRIYEAFHVIEETNDNTKDDFEKLLDEFINGPGYRERRFCPGFFVHSGRSKPSEFDMPQKQPFIQYAAIENAAYDCKYSLVELLKSARYEPSE